MCPFASKFCEASPFCLKKLYFFITIGYFTHYTTSTEWKGHGFGGSYSFIADLLFVNEASKWTTD